MKESGFSQFLTEQRSQVSAVVLWLLHIVYILRGILQENEAKLEMKNFNPPSIFVWR